MSQPITTPGPRLSWLGWAVGIVASVVTIVTAGVATTGRITPWFVVAVLAITVVGFTSIIVYLLSQFSRVINNFNTSIELLHGQLGSIEDGRRVVERTLALARDINDEVSEFRHVPSPAEITQFTRNAVRGMARNLSESLGYECRVCVKQVKNDDTDAPWVEAIARSNRSIASDIGRHHPIAQNTDFDALSRRRETVWFCDDIQEFPGYQTTSNMPTYRSTIVWPIITRVAADHAPDPAFAPIVAYLCVDSDEPGLFDYDQHVPLGWVVCDALARLYEAQRSIWIQ